MKKGQPKLIRTVLPGDIIKLWIKEPGELILIPYETEKNDYTRNNNKNANTN